MNEHTEAKLHAEAVEWLVALQDPETDPEDPYPDPVTRWKAFCRWSTESDQNLDAFRQAVCDANALRDFDPHHLIDIRKLIFEAKGNVVRFPNDLTTLACSGSLSRNPQPTTRPMRWPWAAAAALLGLICIPLIFERIATSTNHYSSGIGQRVFVPLEDGSTVLLNTRTEIAVNYGPKNREVTLLAGEAIFKLRHDERRPFRVLTGDAVIRDVGTTFAVYKHPDGVTTISVLDGRVEILSVPTPRSDATVSDDRAKPLELSTGHQATIDPTQPHGHVVVTEVPLIEQQRRLAWEDGKLTFNGETLSEVIVEFNRYNRRQLVVADAAIRDWKIGGTFQAVDLDAFVDTLQRSFGIDVRNLSGRSDTVQLRRETLPH